ncbi:hypothetical protein MPH_06880 [Macrophomina phaseolina MS6]|uniref:Uncharacterized protein n=1 Tax=Macrophomina phaseolina (strain MS6) TaxID=1126212 RepID=K2S095_MACPH|nr:hypothetical protein MPH_06880 [Macrophomina phaseolina MS6]
MRDDMKAIAPPAPVYDSRYIRQDPVEQANVDCAHANPLSKQPVALGSVPADYLRGMEFSELCIIRRHLTWGPTYRSSSHSFVFHDKIPVQRQDHVGAGGYVHKSPREPWT